MPDTKQPTKSLAQLRAELARQSRIQEEAARKAADIERQIREKSPTVRFVAVRAIGEALVAAHAAGQRQIDVPKLRAAAISLLPKRTQRDAQDLVETLLADPPSEPKGSNERSVDEDATSSADAVTPDAAAAPAPTPASIPQGRATPPPPAIDDFPVPPNYASQAQPVLTWPGAEPASEPTASDNRVGDTEAPARDHVPLPNAIASPMPKDAQEAKAPGPKVDDCPIPPVHGPQPKWRPMRPGTYSPKN